MDPEANRAEQGRIRQRRREKRPLVGDAGRLRELQQAMREWRARGGEG